MLAVLGISLTLFNTVFLSGVSQPFIEGVKTFRYFTIQSNLIVALYFGLSYTNKWNNSKKFDSLMGGVAIYITITFIVFMTMIDPYLTQVGLSLIGSIFLHYIVPALVIVFLIHYRYEYHFSSRDPFIWLIYPLSYLIFMLIYGKITNDYIYPFFQVDEIGVFRLIIMITIMILFFTFLSFLLVKILSKRENANI